MDYREVEPPQALRSLVKAGWSLRGGRRGADTLCHAATPDGCIEIIRRLSGRSAWGGAQPERFVAGLVTVPAEIMLSGDSHFVGLRLWPWAWNALARVPSPLLVDRWHHLAEAAPGFDMPATIEEAFAAVAPVAVDEPTAALGDAILRSRTVEALSMASGRPRRWLQRWFERKIGMPPRRYLRLLRFQDTLAGLQRSEETLALQAAEHGYSDQAHMAREFRAIGRAQANEARRRAKGPFL